MVRVKICGLTRLCDIDAVNKEMPDYIGFVFVKGSKRYITPGLADHMKCKLKKGILAVGVFVNANIDTIASMVRLNTIDVIQLHGDENSDYIRELRSKTGKVKIIKALEVKSAEELSKLANIKAEYILLDNGKGGTGKTFDWSLFPKDIHQKIFLAGGVSLENIDKAISLKPFAVDISSGVETDGLKDPVKIREFIRRVRNG
ncbi:MAG TPA: N-(5'-phosphoribosyl)anthranilate isomerase [Ruminococcaceae bacterium]|nr:N-(5'-phosphoribosyl)anthranilate isomerase [Oscillospiraceae bacterium]